MSPAMLFVLQWYGAIAAAIAAFVVSLDLGRRPTGWAFVLFVTSSVAFILYGFLDPRPEEAIASLNLVLLAINVFGVYRYLIRKKPVQA
ncbi:hypothetical protein [Sphingosinicella rhizophila]|uniref:Uncharacterized protein n=1 Tax=Sphingosinicella rhizophila TaxID=3050082 RepID=A0ABU3Q1Z1_9SPHN|nr:hypothetical protein [Sphingosinicella sp. GR2756]MDT9597436.1 hypothetical protein [Sphingosinicella sp. GR2756]